MFPVLVVYLGLVAMFLGGVSILKPLRFLGICSRLQAVVLLGTGVGVVILGGSLPAGEARIARPQTQLDQFMPVYQFHEFHSARIAAPPEKVYQSLKQVTAEEILFFHTLVWIRRFGRPGPEGVLNPPPHTPLLDVATRTGFIVLAEEPDNEFVMGTLMAAPRDWRPSGKPAPEGFKRLVNSRQAGFAPVAMNFHLEDCAAPQNAPGSGASSSAAPPPSPCTLLTTETRIYATDSSTRRAFARYWRVIYPGSSLIRSMWLRAIRKRAESG